MRRGGSAAATPPAGLAIAAEGDRAGDAAASRARVNDADLVKLRVATPRMAD